MVATYVAVAGNGVVSWSVLGHACSITRYRIVATVDFGRVL